MKKILSMLLISAMAAAIITGCGKSDEGTDAAATTGTTPAATTGATTGDDKMSGTPAATAGATAGTTGTAPAATAGSTTTG